VILSRIRNLSASHAQPPSRSDDPLKKIAGCAEGLCHVSVCSVKRLFQIISVILALAWLPIASHCSWEGLAGDMFKCSPTEKGDCSNDGDSCVAVESGSYKIRDTTPEVPTPLFAFVLFELPILVPDLTQQAAPTTAAPDEIPASWLFYSRTALPPRAPSLS
jgi:hypothetical protein